jgi:hypothetical protein
MRRAQAIPDLRGSQASGERSPSALAENSIRAFSKGLSTLSFETRSAFFLAAIVLLQAIGNRHRMNPDGISYLDLGRLIAAGQWAEGFNAYWSPLFPWLIGLATALVRPVEQTSFALVHLVNFVVACGSLAAYVFFLRALLDLRRKHSGTRSTPALSDRLITALALAVYLWFVIGMVPVWLVSPDLATTAAALVAFGLFSKALAEPRRSGHFFNVGLVLGVGYYAKTAMFPVALFFLVAVAVSASKPREAVRRSGLVLAGFLLLALPLVAMLSHRHGSLTIGEAARMNYGWAVNQSRQQFKAEVLVTARDTVSVRRLPTDPEVLVFEGAVRGTYPPWFAPAHWLESPGTRVDATRQAGVLLRHLYTYLDLLSIPLVLVLTVILGGRWGQVRWSEATPFALLVLPALGALGMYSLVHVEKRYVAVFLAVTVVALFAALSIMVPARPRILRATALALTLVFGGLGLGWLAVDAARGFVGYAPPAPWRIAAGAEMMAPLKDTTIAVVGEPARDVAYLAHLARSRITVVVPESETSRFWGGEPHERDAALACMAEAGAVAAVSIRVPPKAVSEGWRRIAGTTYHLHGLRVAGAECPVNAPSPQ